MMQNIQVGKYLRGTPERMRDGTYFDILPDTMLLIMFMSNPTETELEEFSHGEAKFAFLSEDGIIFFLMKLGNMEWVDAPYNKYLGEEPVDTTRPGEKEGYSITMILADGTDSAVRAIRVVSLYNKFSNQFMDEVEKQPIVLRYDEVLMKKYAKYSTSEEMLKEAIKEIPIMPRIKKNKYNIAYFYTTGQEFARKMAYARVNCDYCNVVLEGADRVTVIPFLNSAYCADCGKLMIEDCKAIDEREEKHQEKLEKYFMDIFKSE